MGWRCSAAAWGGDPPPPDAVSPWPGGAATRRWPTCGPGLRARGSRGRSGMAAARKAGRALGGAAGRAPEEVEGEAAWRRRGRPGAHLWEQPKQRRPLRQEPAMRWRPPSREERGAARRERLGGGDLSVERMFYTIGERSESLDWRWTVKNNWTIWTEMGLLCITFFLFYCTFVK